MLLLRLWKSYKKCLAVHPVKTQVVSSGLIWGLGDVFAQTITRSTAVSDGRGIDDDDKKFRINWKRVATTSLFGFGFVGPVGHFWYEGLDRLIRVRMSLRPNSLRFVATKVLVDGFLFGPIDLLVFFTYMGFSTGKSIPQIKEDVKRDFIPAFILEGGFWPVIQVVNFRFVPVKYQLLYVNFFCLLDSSFLSWLEQQADASWKKWMTSFMESEEQETEC
ncbi:unnamed protein product [Rhodiola kirilowii]